MWGVKVCGTGGQFSVDGETDKSHLLTVKELEMLSLGLRSLSMVDNRVLGLDVPKCIRLE